MAGSWKSTKFELANIALTRALVELAGFEPAAFSLRKMRSKPSDQGKRDAFTGLWGGCGANGVRQRETA